MGTSDLCNELQKDIKMDAPMELRICTAILKVRSAPYPRNPTPPRTHTRASLSLRHNKYGFGLGGRGFQLF